MFSYGHQYRRSGDSLVGREGLQPVALVLTELPILRRPPEEVEGCMGKVHAGGLAELPSCRDPVLLSLLAVVLSHADGA